MYISMLLICTFSCNDSYSDSTMQAHTSNLLNLNGTHRELLLGTLKKKKQTKGTTQVVLYRKASKGLFKGKSGELWNSYSGFTYAAELCTDLQHAVWCSCCSNALVRMLVGVQSQLENVFIGKTLPSSSFYFVPYLED